MMKSATPRDIFSKGILIISSEKKELSEVIKLTDFIYKPSSLNTSRISFPGKGGARFLFPLIISS
jgi:hypothetical protein